MATTQIEPSTAKPAEGIHRCPTCGYPTFDCYELCGWCEAEAAALQRTAREAS